MIWISCYKDVSRLVFEMNLYMMYVHFFTSISKFLFVRTSTGPCPRAIVKRPRSTSQERWPDVICARSTEVLGLTSKLLVWRNVEDGEWGGGLRCFEDFSLGMPGSWWIGVLMKNLFGICVCISLEPNPSFEAKMGWEDMRSGSLHIIAEYSILEHSCRTHAGRGHHRDCMAAVYSRNDHGSCLRHFTALCSGGQFSLCLVSWVWTGAVATTRATWLKQNHRPQNDHNRCGISVRLFDKIVSVVFSLFSKLRWLYLIVTLMIRCDVNDSNMIICRM